MTQRPLREAKRQFVNVSLGEVRSHDREMKKENYFCIGRPRSSTCYTLLFNDTSLSQLCSPWPDCISTEITSQRKLLQFLSENLLLAATHCREWKKVLQTLTIG